MKEAVIVSTARTGLAKSVRGKPRFTLDCTGRAGVLAREHRVKEAGFSTLALCGIWRGAMSGVDPTHTLVEAYSDGWVWSIPLDAQMPMKK